MTPPVPTPDNHGDLDTITIRVYHRRGEYRWTAVAGNNVKVATGGQWYNHEDDALAFPRRFIPNAVYDFRYKRKADG